MEENTHHHELKKNTIVSTLSLFFQSGYSAVLGLTANLVLTILLTPAIFGIYITVLSIVSVLNYFSDIGLAASLIQKKELKNEDVKTTFTVQQILIITLILLGFIATPYIRQFYKLPQDGVYLFWAVLISFFISSLKTIPSIFLERKIQFQKIVLVQIIENTVFYVSVIIFALMRFELYSFTYAVLLRAVVGLIAIYRISFWMPQIGISVASLRDLLSFGIPFQASSFLALFKDDLITLFLGKVVGFEGVGYIGWAKKWAEAPLKIIMESLGRVMFTLLARVQEEQNRLSAIIERIIYYQSLLLTPAILGMALIMPYIIEIIPKYNKWAPALPLFYLFCLSAFFSSYSTPFMNLFNALGKVRISFTFMLFWTALTWAFTPLFTKYFGYLGFPLSQLLLSLTFVLVVYKAKQMLDVHLLNAALPPLVMSLIMGLVVESILLLLKGSLLSVIMAVILGGLVYLVSGQLLFKIDITKEIRKILLKHTP